MAILLLIQKIVQGLLEGLMGKSCKTLHSLPEPPPSVDSGKERGLAVMTNHVHYKPKR